MPPDLLNWIFPHGQVAQLVERSPEKAGVGGSIPSLATTLKQLVAAKNRGFQSTEHPQTAFACSASFTSISFQMLRALLPVLAMCCRPSLA